MTEPYHWSCKIQSDTVGLAIYRAILLNRKLQCHTILKLQITEPYTYRIWVRVSSRVTLLKPQNFRAMIYIIWVRNERERVSFLKLKADCRAILIQKISA
jgi:hypothetical protein